MKTSAVALLGFVLAGCAPAIHASAPSAATPVSPWRDGADDEAAVSPAVTAPPTEARAAEPPAPPTDGATASTTDTTPAAMTLDPDMIHQARIAMAREALVEENENKERVDLAEELQRELAALQASAEASKSRVRRARATKNQP